MPINYTLIHDTGKHIGVAFRRISDGSLFDFSTNQFYPNLSTIVIKQRLWPVPERPAPDLKVYADRYMNTPATIFLDGDYEIIAHDIDLFNAGVPSVLWPPMYTTMLNGDDATVFPVSQIPLVPGTYPFAVGGITGTLTVLIATVVPVSPVATASPAATVSPATKTPAMPDQEIG